MSSSPTAAQPAEGFKITYVDPEAVSSKDAEMLTKLTRLLAEAPRHHVHSDLTLPSSDECQSDLLLETWTYHPVNPADPAQAGLKAVWTRDPISTEYGAWHAWHLAENPSPGVLGRGPKRAEAMLEAMRGWHAIPPETHMSELEYRAQGCPVITGTFAVVELVDGQLTPAGSPTRLRRFRTEYFSSEMGVKRAAVVPSGNWAYSLSGWNLSVITPGKMNWEAATISSSGNSVTFHYDKEKREEWVNNRANLELEYAFLYFAELLANR